MDRSKSAEIREFYGSHCSEALYQGTTLVGPHKEVLKENWALAPALLCRLKMGFSHTLFGPQFFVPAALFWLEKDANCLVLVDSTRPIPVGPAMTHTPTGTSCFSCFLRPLRIPWRGRRRPDPSPSSEPRHAACPALLNPRRPE
jgi:hypothetical protein